MAEKPPNSELEASIREVSEATGVTISQVSRILLGDATESGRLSESQRSMVREELAKRDLPRPIVPIESRFFSKLIARGLKAFAPDSRMVEYRRDLTVRRYLPGSKAEGFAVKRYGRWTSYTGDEIESGGTQSHIDESGTTPPDGHGFFSPRSGRWIASGRIVDITELGSPIRKG